MTGKSFVAWLTDLARRPLVCGILNVTPDSFSDGGRFANLTAATDHVRELISEGADLIDIGGESTRPGSSPVGSAEQIRRILPVLRELRDLDIALSIDTTRADVAEAALDGGASIVNDISAGRDDAAMLPLIARRGASAILMHMQGTPATMQLDPRYADVTKEVANFLRERAKVAIEAGIARDRILLDPGIGFGKSEGHNLTILREMRSLVDSLDGRPVVVGTSRKGFIGTITGEPIAQRRGFGTAATVAWAIEHGASIVRVHDVGPMKQVVRMIEAIQG